MFASSYSPKTFWSDDNMEKYEPIATVQEFFEFGKTGSRIAISPDNEIVKIKANYQELRRNSMDSTRDQDPFQDFVEGEELSSTTEPWSTSNMATLEHQFSSEFESDKEATTSSHYPPLESLTLSQYFRKIMTSAKPVTITKLKQEKEFDSFLRVSAVPK